MLEDLQSNYLEGVLLVEVHHEGRPEVLDYAVFVWLRHMNEVVPLYFVSVGEADLVGEGRQHLVLHKSKLDRLGLQHLPKMAVLEQVHEDEPALAQLYVVAVLLDALLHLAHDLIVLVFAGA